MVGARSRRGEAAVPGPDGQKRRHVVVRERAGGGAIMRPGRVGAAAGGDRRIPGVSVHSFAGDAVPARMESAARALRAAATRAAASGAHIPAVRGAFRADDDPAYGWRV